MSDVKTTNFRDLITRNRAARQSIKNDLKATKTVKKQTGMHQIKVLERELEVRLAPLLEKANACGRTIQQTDCGLDQLVPVGRRGDAFMTHSVDVAHECCGRCKLAGGRGVVHVVLTDVR